MHVYVEASFANAFSNKYFTFGLLFKKYLTPYFMLMFSRVCQREKLAKEIKQSCL